MEVSHISNSFVLSLRFNNALEKSNLLGVKYDEDLTGDDM